jgi:murein DD-endopeptidase MepM/ murein hydrolase activator NlpD
MKKIPILFLVLISIIGVFVLGFTTKTNYEPRRLYQVYLNAEIIGTIESKEELENYINSRGEEIKQRLKVDNVYAPTGLEIKELNTYQNSFDKVEDVYEKIAKKSNFTIKGYQFTLRREDIETKETIVQKIYVTNKEIFERAVTEVIKIYVGHDKYQAYIDNNIIKIKTTGRETKNIYLEEDITIKETLIEVQNQIFLTSEELSQYLLFGENNAQKPYTIKLGETIEDIANNNQISVNEFLLSNPKLNNKTTLVYAGQEVMIGVPNPKINVVLEEYVVDDRELNYNTTETYDPKMLAGSRTILQEGRNGKIRVSQNIKTVNGQMVFVDTVSTETLEPTIDKIIKLGTRIVPNVGTGNWGCPTDRGKTITSGYEWRINPITRKREFHNAIDISGSANDVLYAVDNGTVHEVSYTRVNGNYVIINHNNGYYTYYGHMIRKSTFLTVGQSIEKGQRVGNMGATGYATGVHVHFSVWVGLPWQGYHVNPNNFVKCNYQR